MQHTPSWLPPPDLVASEHDKWRLIGSHWIQDPNVGYARLLSSSPSAAHSPSPVAPSEATRPARAYKVARSSLPVSAPQPVWSFPPRATGRGTARVERGKQAAVACAVDPARAQRRKRRSMEDGEWSSARVHRRRVRCSVKCRTCPLVIPLERSLSGVPDGRVLARRSCVASADDAAQLTSRRSSGPFFGAHQLAALLGPNSAS